MAFAAEKALEWIKPIISRRFTIHPVFYYIPYHLLISLNRIMHITKYLLITIFIDMHNSILWYKMEFMKSLIRIYDMHK